MPPFEQQPGEAELMKRILGVRLTNLEEEKALCKQLLDIAEAEQSSYALAFANLYLVDSLLALGEYDACDFYLIRANYLCREHNYTDLLAILCNLAGLYYQSINDGQMALQFYLEGLTLAREMNDSVLESKLLNNIGRVFSWCQDGETAHKYVHEAYRVIEHCPDEEGNGIAMSCLSNLANICLDKGDKRGAEKALVLCETLGGDELYHRLRLACEWCNYYAIFHEHERCDEAFEKLAALGFFEFEDKLFVFDMVLELCDALLGMGEQRRVEQLFSFLDGLSEDVPLGSRYILQTLRVRYCELFEVSDRLNEEYREYYELTCRVHKMDDSMRVQSMKSQMHLKRIMEERARMRAENQDLEKAGQLDGLTGLYNRRHFNRIIDKFTGEASSFGFILIDIDFFKQYNDFYGHFAGDDALKTVAEVLSENAGEGFYPSRYGGDEFVCLAVDRSDNEVASYVLCVQDDLRRRKIEHVRSKVSGTLTLSIGWCFERVEGRRVDPDELLALADEALYEAKDGGRNARVRKFRRD